MLIGIHDEDKAFLHGTGIFSPNYALMKIAAYHKTRGDMVEWYLPLKRMEYDIVYTSRIFDYTPMDLYLPENTICGGTGHDVKKTLPDEIDSMFPDYSMYPTCDYAIGFITRGCPNHCPWCVVPEKEGELRPYRKWEQLVRTDSDKLVLMDNNILASDFGVRELYRLSKTRYEIDVNQGMDIRLFLDEHAKIFKNINWMKYIRFSCDSTSQLPYFEKAVELFRRNGIADRKLFVYLLVQKDLHDANDRIQALQGMCKSVNIYAQAERNSKKGIYPTPLQLEFTQRYVYGRGYKRETWSQYCKRKRFTNLDLG